MSSINLATSEGAWIVGIDLAWGDRNGDGLCLIRASRFDAEVYAIEHTHGDLELLAWLEQNIAPNDPALLIIDAPLVMKNQTGSRPVDRKTHELFHREHAGCYPANLTKCPRPARLAELLKTAGYVLDFNLSVFHRLAVEVYPHPAMVRLFQLDRIIKYKKGLVAQKQSEFARLQRLIIDLIRKDFPQLLIPTEVTTFLGMPWTKRTEDLTDALFCALIGYHHWIHQGQKSDPIGDIDTGFILLPAETRSILQHPA